MFGYLSTSWFWPFCCCAQQVHGLQYVMHPHACFGNISTSQNQKAFISAPKGLRQWLERRRLLSRPGTFFAFWFKGVAFTPDFGRFRWNLRPGTLTTRGVFVVIITAIDNMTYFVLLKVGHRYTNSCVHIFLFPYHTGRRAPKWRSYGYSYVRIFSHITRYIRPTSQSVMFSLLLTTATCDEIDGADWWRWGKCSNLLSLDVPVVFLLRKFRVRVMQLKD